MVESTLSDMKGVTGVVDMPVCIAALDSGYDKFLLMMIKGYSITPLIRGLSLGQYI